MEVKDILKPVGNYLGGKIVKDVLSPIDSLIDKNLTDIFTSLGAFVIREISGKFYRQISFTIGVNRSDNWMEEALYGVLYKYNDVIHKGSKLELSNKSGYSDGSMMYARLADGAHPLIYRKWRITLGIATASTPSATGRIYPVRTYVIAAPTTDPEFVECFKNELVEQRDAILKINSKSKFLNVYKDYPDGSDVYWEIQPPANKRRIDTIYLPREQLKTIVDVINRFFADRKEYERLGVPWNLKILFYGIPASGKSSLAKMIASEWGRNLYEIGDGGKNGKYVPLAIESSFDCVRNPVFVINDLDRFPQLVSEADLDINKKDDVTEERLGQRQIFRRFLNALDGSNVPEGRIIVATANDISKFSPTLLREGRFDLVMEIGGVTEEVFRKYVYDVYHREIDHPFYLSSDELTIGKFNQDTLIKKLSYDEFIAKYTSSTPPIKKPKTKDPEPVKDPDVKDQETKNSKLSKLTKKSNAS